MWKKHKKDAKQENITVWKLQQKCESQLNRKPCMCGLRRFWICDPESVFINFFSFIFYYQEEFRHYIVFYFIYIYT